MTNTNPAAEGPPLGLTPILAVSDAHAAIAFYAQAFGATEVARISAPDTSRLMHVRMVVFGTVFVFMDEIPELAAEESGFHSPDRLNGTSVSLHLQVADAESVWRQALTAGALPIVPLAKQFWGELYGRLKDPFGHEWTIAQFLLSSAGPWPAK
jgi:PhnB protein